MENKGFQVIIPTTDRDYNRVKRDLVKLGSRLRASEIIFIGPKALREPVERDAAAIIGAAKETSAAEGAEEGGAAIEGVAEDESAIGGTAEGDAAIIGAAKESPEPVRVRYLDENELIPYEEMREIMARRLALGGYSMNANSKPGWYYQQFLKMAFSDICEGEYYMSWDADTIPLRPVNMFDTQGHPYFDVKNEYMPTYFRTIKKLFGLDKLIEKSFISEHMLFKKDRMKELIAEVEALDIADLTGGAVTWKNGEGSVSGGRFYEKIFFSLDLDNMLRGFSEFETYGTWMCARYPGEYALRDWNSMRIAGAFMKPGEMTEEDEIWLSGDYDSVTFESYHKYSPELGDFFRNPRYRSKISARQFYQIVLESGFFGDMKDGGLGNGDGVFPI